MENNIEFRIWDTKENKWLSSKVGRWPTISRSGIVSIYDNTEGMDNEDVFNISMKKPLRYEVSQYIGRKDSKGVKAFTGDRVEASTSRSLLINGTLVSQRGNVYVMTENDLHSLNDFESFTIIGNKWEGLHAAGASAPVEPVCDSAVQQQNKDAQDIEGIKKMFKWHEHYLSPPTSFFTDTGVEYRKVGKSGPEMTRQAIEELVDIPPYIITQPIFEYKDPDFEKRRKRMQTVLDQQFYEGGDRSSERYSYKQKWEHEADRISYLSRIVMKCKHTNQSSPIGVMTEINELLNYKINTSRAENITELLWEWDDYEKNDPQGYKLKLLRIDHPKRYKEIFDRKFADKKVIELKDWDISVRAMNFIADCGYKTAAEVIKVGSEKLKAEFIGKDKSIAEISNYIRATYNIEW